MLRNVDDSVILALLSSLTARQQDMTAWVISVLDPGRMFHLILVLNSEHKQPDEGVVTDIDSVVNCGSVRVAVEGLSHLER